MAGPLTILTIGPRGRAVKKGMTGDQVHKYLTARTAAKRHGLFVWQYGKQTYPGMAAEDWLSYNNYLRGKNPCGITTRPTRVRVRFNGRIHPAVAKKVNGRVKIFVTPKVARSINPRFKNPKEYYKVWFSRGAERTAKIVVDTEQFPLGPNGRRKRSIADYSRLFPMSEAMKMKKIHLTRPYATWSEAFNA